MKRIRALAIVLVLIVAISIVAGSAIASDPVNPSINVDDIVILYTNDVHCGIGQVKDSNGLVTNIGYAGVAELKKYAASIVGNDHVTLVDAGDALQGDAVGTMSKGGYIVDIMNAVGYDIFVPGNHEFDYGMERMQELMGMMEAKVISSNFIDLKTGDPVFDRYTMLTYSGTKVAYIGVTTPESFTKSTPAYFQDADGNYIFSLSEKNKGEDLYNAVQSAVDAALAAGADIVIAVGHLGIDEASSPWRSIDVIANTSGIDAFIDGHSHSTVASESVPDKNGSSVILVQTGTKLANVGCMTISADGTIKASLISGYSTQNSDTEVFVNNILNALEADLAEVVATSAVDLTANDPLTGTRMVRNRETNLGDLCADAYRYILGNGKIGDEAGPADISFVNGGGIRADIPAGDISFGQVIAVHPYNNVGCVVEASGSQIIDALEMASRSAPSELGGFLQVSGLTYMIDLSITSSVVTSEQGEFISITGERRVRDVLVGGVPIDLDKTYTLASHNYMLLDGGDGINMFRNNNIVVQPVILDNKVLITYIEDHLGGVVGDDYANPYGQGRIKMFDPSVKLAVISDPHLYTTSLGTAGDAFQDALNEDRKMLAESEAILDEAIRRICASDAEYVLIPGDLTKDGEKINHELLASKLNTFIDAGKQVFVINGNHDISNNQAVSYDENGTARVDTIDTDDFRRIYADFGYNQAVAKDTDSLSYSVNLGDDYLLIVIDSCKYNNSTTYPEQSTGGSLDGAKMAWVLDQVYAATIEGRRPVIMMHHGVIPHTPTEPVFFASWLVDDYQNVAETLADAGVGLVLTGHFHGQDVVAITTSNGNTLYDMETGSLVTAPSPIRYISLDSAYIAYNSVHIDSVPGIADFNTYKYEYLISGLVMQVPPVLQAAGNVDAEIATVMANQKLTPDLTIAQLLAGSMAKHYYGDEVEGSYALVIDTLASSGDSVQQMIGMIARSMSNDATGVFPDIVFDNTTDNDGALVFSPGAPLTRGLLAATLFKTISDGDMLQLNAGHLEFIDVSGSSVYNGAVAWAAGAGIMGGYGYGIFGPEDPVTREQLAAILLRYATYMGKSTVGAFVIDPVFADMNEISDYATEGVEWCLSNGILADKSTDRFDPKGTVTRSEVSAAILVVQKRDDS